MDTVSPELNDSDNKKENSRLMHFGTDQVQHWAVYLTVVIITAVFGVIVYTLDTSHQVVLQPPVPPIQSQQESVTAAKSHVSTDHLIGKLKQHNLWEIHPSQEVPRFFIESYPADLDAIDDISTKKKVFLHSLLPHALFVRQEALYKRDRLESILSKIDCSLEDINFDTERNQGSLCSWSDFLADDDVSFIQQLSRNYRVMTAEGLLARVDAVPTSIILAQGALESSWGSSRFTREGNSIFGMWTWNTKGMIPAKRDEGKTHKVKAYENILDSVRAYHLTLNRFSPYDQFRQLRRQTDDPLILADGLTSYSERGEDYVEEIKNVILSNDLLKYDTYRLSDLDLLEFPNPITKNSSIADSAKASL
jgi:Bax protein